MHELVATEERKAVIAELEQAQVHLERACDLLSRMGLKERAHKTRNFAQNASDMKHLLALDWHDEDQNRPALETAQVK